MNRRGNLSKRSDGSPTRNRKLIVEQLEERICLAFDGLWYSSPFKLVLKGTKMDDKLLNLSIGPNGRMSYLTSDSSQQTPHVREPRGLNTWISLIPKPTAQNPLVIEIVGYEGNDLVDLTMNLPGFDNNSVSYILVNGNAGRDKFDTPSYMVSPNGFLTSPIVFPSANGVPIRR
jgi:hypothetical protein